MPLLFAGAALGVVAGLAVVAFAGLTDASFIAFQWLSDRSSAHVPTALLRPVFTAIAILLAWLVVTRARVKDGQNVPDIKLAVAKRRGVVVLRPVAARTIASAITLGGGGSVGSEGPVAVLGAATGSKIGRVLRLPARHVKILVGCGAAAGIAGAFNAPFAGAFFALEEILGSFSVGAFSPVVIASVVGALTARSVLGTHPAFHVPEAPDVHVIAGTLLYAMLGVACGLVSAGYARVERWGARAPSFWRGPAWLRPVAGGVIVGAIVAASGGVLAGNGHLAIPASVFGGMPAARLLSLSAAKIGATVLTFASGGSGGIFTPTLFIGAALGGGLGVAAAHVVSGHIVHPATWALAGMTGLVSGATRAPLTAIFIVYELTGNTSLIVPLMVVSVVSFVTARRWSPHGLYDGWLASRGEHLGHGADASLMERIAVRDAMDVDSARVPPSAAAADVARVMARSQQIALPVVESDGSLIGLVSHHALREALVHRAETAGLLIAADLAEAVESVEPDATLRSALTLMNAKGRDALPVVEPDDDAVPRFVGLLDRADLLAAYERELEQLV